MRIISGANKGKRFSPPSNTKARPTTDQAKEALFNILENSYYDGFAKLSVLDLFSGTGNISFEFVSRGCLDVTAVEMESPQASYIRSVAEKLGYATKLQVYKMDVFKFLKNPGLKQYDFIFADPPYTLPNIQELPDLVLNSGKLTEKGLFVLEHGEKNSFTKHAIFSQLRRYGKVHFSFFDPEKELTTDNENDVENDLEK
ncbi:MAG: Ribosomal small subunit methyltransferase [Bacteroidota bacterium]